MVDSRYREVYYSVLEYFFARCIPGILVQYLVRCVGAIPVDSRSFIEPVDAPHSLDGSLLDVPSGQLEEVWQSIAVVRVSGLCPHWTSKAYHGLVELYLDPGISVITESQLVGIFRASPKLQVFHLRTVVEPSENGLAIVPVYLEDLRDIMIMVQSDDNFSGILTLLWINPGSASLHMSFAGTPWGEISDFFDRSNITRFYLIHWEPCNLTRVFKESSRLETLVLNGRDFDVEGLSSLLNPHHVDDVNPDEAPPTPRRVQIDALYLLWFNGFIFEEIQAVVEKYSVQKLLIYGGKLSYQAVEGRVVSDNARNTRIKLSSITACPVIEYYYDANLIHQHCDDWMADALIY
ncbi:hypothetical protein FRC11_003939 [Ceratobasidium sp. 423]|nr:hypothetical protein FRC11_003939 [Ceratobasidium sp. 423]